MAEDPNKTSDALFPENIYCPHMDEIDMEQVTQSFKVWLDSCSQAIKTMAKAETNKSQQLWFGIKSDNIEIINYGNSNGDDISQKILEEPNRHVIFEALSQYCFCVTCDREILDLEMYEKIYGDSIKTWEHQPKSDIKPLRNLMFQHLKESRTYLQSTHGP